MRQVTAGINDIEGGFGKLAGQPFANMLWNGEVVAGLEEMNRGVGAPGTRPQI